MLVAVLLLSSTSMYPSYERSERNPSNELKTKVEALLDGYFEMSSDKEFKATVIFTINKEQELVVLSVDSIDSEFCDFVKSSLNYQEIKIEGVIEGRKYTLPITMRL